MQSRVLRFAFLFLVVAAASQAAFRKSALVIGINGYGLQYADRDATEFAKTIQSPLAGGFPNSRIKLLLNEQADRETIIQSIVAVGRNVDQDMASYPADKTMVYIFISGHSKVDPATEEAYFMPAKSDPGIAATGIRSDDFLRMVKTYIHADYIMYFFDTCHAAASQNEGSISKDYQKDFQTALDAKWKVYFQTAKERHMGLFSSSASQKSYEDQSLQHGIFTHYLLKGLSGEADLPPNGNADGTVTSDELKTYLEKFVPPRAKDKGVQTPTASLVWNGTLPLATVSPDLKLGLYFEDVPAELPVRLREMLQKNQHIQSISIAGDNSWTAVAAETFWTNVPGFMDAYYAHMKVESPGIGLSRAGVSSGGAFVQIYGWNGYAPRLVSPKVIEFLEQLRNKRSTVNAVILDPDRAMIVYDTYLYIGWGLPDNFASELQAVYNRKQKINQVAFGPSNGWIVTFGDVLWRAFGLRQSLLNVMWSLTERNVKIQALAVNPATGGWVVVAP